MCFFQVIITPVTDGTCLLLPKHLLCFRVSVPGERLMRKRPLALLCNVLLLTVIALAQEPKSGDMAGLDPPRDQSSRETSSSETSSRDIPRHEMPKTHDMPGTS